MAPKRSSTQKLSSWTERSRSVKQASGQLQHKKGRMFCVPMMSEVEWRIRQRRRKKGAGKARGYKGGDLEASEGTGQW